MVFGEIIAIALRQEANPLLVFLFLFSARTVVPRPYYGRPTGVVRPPIGGAGAAGAGLGSAALGGALGALGGTLGCLLCLSAIGALGLFSCVVAITAYTSESMATVDFSSTWNVSLL